MRAESVRPPIVACALVLAGAAAACAQPPFGDGLDALRTGRYDDAIRILGAHAAAADASPAARRAYVRALVEVGRYDDAEAAAREGAEATPELLATLGSVLRLTGRRAESEAAFRQAIERGASDRLVAELELAILLHERGEREEARRRFDAFIDVYNGAAPGALDAAELTAVATAVRYLGATDPDLFRDALRAYDEAAAADPSDPEPRLRSGDLFLEKYNSADARSTFQAVLRTNPNNARALLGLARVLEFDGEPGAADTARRALEVNPNLVGARVLLARLALAGEDTETALEQVERAFAVDSTSIDALAVLAATHRFQGDRDAFDAVRRRAEALYPRSAALLETAAELAVQTRDYRGAVELARQALERDSLSWRARGILGINELRLGRMEEGRAQLEAAFAGDPFNVWYKNSLDLLDTFVEYEEVETEHFRFILHGDEAALLGPYAGALAEEAYDALAERYDYRPEPPIRVEVFPRHADFSVRTFGLTGLGALGVSFGGVLAMDSPAARQRGEFNWGSTLWHEIAHAFHLGMTGHRVPRWFAEGLAVHEERQAREGWGHDPDPGFLTALAEDRLAPVSRLNDGIMRPSYPAQVMHSYYQASLVMQRIEETHGFEALVEMLHAFGEGASDEDVFRDVLGVELEAFDELFDAWLRERFAAPLAGLKGENGFIARVERGRDRFEAGDVDAAIQALERAKEIFPEYAGPGSPYAALARIHMERGDTARAAAELQRLTGLNENDYDAHVELAALRESLGDLPGAAAALERVMYIHPYDIALHERLAELFARIGEPDKVVRERRAVLALEPADRAEAHYRLALALRDAGDSAAARREVLRALESAPGFVAAQELLLELRDASGSGGGEP